MSSSIVTVLLWSTALSSGLMAGIYFAFSVFIMKAFSKLEIQQTITTMNAINETILRSLFMPVFFGSSIISFLLIIVAIAQWDKVGSGLMLVTGLVYFVGMFMCTAVFNVPLNNQLAKINKDSNNVKNAKKVWSHYLKTWTRWNHLRTVSSLVTCVLSIWLLSA